MPVFALSKGKLTEIAEVTIDRERHIQKMTEDNLQGLFGLQFVDTEFQVNDLRVDTLAFDPESKSFVIIEYKKKENFSVIDQGFAYLGLLVNNKAEFVLRYNDKATKPLKKDEVGWQQSKVIFVSPSFTTYQRQAIGFKDLPIELWEVKTYTNETILFNQIQSPEKGESIKNLGQKSELIRTVSRQVKAVTTAEHLEKGSDAIKLLYSELEVSVSSMGPDIKIRPKVQYVAYVRKTNFLDIVVYRSQLNLFLNMKKGQLNDPQKIAKDVSNVGHWGNGDYCVILKDSSQLGYALSLIRQSYDQNNIAMKPDERSTVSEKVNAVLNYDDKTRTRRKEIS